VAYGISGMPLAAIESERRALAVGRDRFLDCDEPGLASLRPDARLQIRANCAPHFAPVRAATACSR
jgi:hypothetical protein